MKKFLSLAACLATTCLASSVGAADLANLKATFTVKGKVAAAKPITNINDPFCASLKIASEDVVVDSATGAIQNLALYVDSKSLKESDLKSAANKAEKATLVIDNKDCRFEPHVIVVRPGQTLEVKNSDKTGHNANFAFLKNESINFQVPAGGKKELPIKEEEPAPIPISCGSHPWMKAFIIIQDHPYVGVTNAKGALEIKGLPSGKVTFKLWQEVGSIKSVTIGGKSVAVKRGRFELELKPGDNDLGNIVIDAAELAAK